MDHARETGGSGEPATTHTFVVAELPDAMPTFIYVARRTNGSVLYVGITGSLGMRLTAHRDADKWWREAHTISTEIHPDRASASARERVLIDQFNPPHNRSEKLDRKACQQKERDDAFVDLYGQGLTLTDIRRRLDVEYGVVSSLVKRLCEEGRIERRRPGRVAPTTTSSS